MTDSLKYFPSGPIPKANSVNDICAEDAGALRQMLSRAQAFERLNQLASAELPEDLARHTRIACIRDGVLVIAADSAAWGTRARLQSEQWLTAVYKYWPGSIRQLKFRVQTRPPQTTPVKQPRVLSEQVCDHLSQCAENQTDAELAAILQRIAQHRQQATAAASSLNDEAQSAAKATRSTPDDQNNTE